QFRLAPYQVGRGAQDERVRRDGAERVPQAATQRPDGGVREVVDAAKDVREHRLPPSGWVTAEFTAPRAPERALAHLDRPGSHDRRAAPWCCPWWSRTIGAWNGRAAGGGDGPGRALAMPRGERRSSTRRRRSWRAADSTAPGCARSLRPCRCTRR